MKKEYQVSSWAGFLKLCGAPLTPQSLYSLTPQEYRDVGGKSREDYEKFIISQYINEGRNEAYIANHIPDLALMSVQRRIQKWWGSLSEACKQLVGPILALCFKKGWNSAKIRANVPYFQNRAAGSTTSNAVRYYSFQWFGFTASAARNILVTCSLHWFLTTYL